MYDTGGGSYPDSVCRDIVHSGFRETCRESCSSLLLNCINGYNYASKLSLHSRWVVAPCLLFVFLNLSQVTLVDLLPTLSPIKNTVSDMDINCSFLDHRVPSISHPLPTNLISPNGQEVPGKIFATSSNERGHLYFSSMGATNILQWNSSVNLTLTGFYTPPSYYNFTGHTVAETPVLKSSMLQLIPLRPDAW